MDERQAEVCIVGAGAGGLWAAAACARRGLRTVVLEKTGRTGTKVLASGGGRCNLTTTLGPAAAARRYGHQGERFLGPALRTLSPLDVVEHFRRLGVPTRVEPALDKVFPASDSARQVRDALERDARSAGAIVLLDSPVQDVAPAGGEWISTLRSGRVRSRSLLLCTGGQSYPRMGTTGDGYRWLRSLGLDLVEPVPALVPLVSPASWVHALSGVTLDAEVRLDRHRCRRPLLFTHRGLSGPAAMDLSAWVSRSEGPVEVRVDLLPEHSWDQLRQSLVRAAERAGAPRIASVLPLPRRVVATVALRSGLTEPNPRAQRLGRSSRHQLIDALKGLRVPISGTLGFAHAEVTAGGLALHEVDRRTMAVRSQPGLHVCGELLDIDGPIGGLNLQAAFSTAEVAARAMCAVR